MQRGGRSFLAISVGSEGPEFPRLAFRGWGTIFFLGCICKNLPQFAQSLEIIFKCILGNERNLFYCVFVLRRIILNCTETSLLHPWATAD